MKYLNLVEVHTEPAQQQAISQLCSVTGPLNASEAGVDHALKKTSLLFH